MMKISEKDWKNYISRLRKVNDLAAQKVADYMTRVDINTAEGMKQLIDYSYAVATRYGEAATELACQMYDAVAAVSKVSIPSAEPADTATYGEVIKAVKGKMFDTKDPSAVGSAVGRLVKMAGVDTTMKNALRDGAEWAWIPSGDTCAFCLMLASRGWQKASRNAIRRGHAEHIHHNCDCTYQIRFDESLQVEGYDPDALYDEYIGAGETRQERLNSIRRKLYAKNPEKYRAQKRNVYAKKRIIEEERLAKIFRTERTKDDEESAGRRLFSRKIIDFKTGEKSIAEYVESKKPLGNFRALPKDRVVPALREKASLWLEKLSGEEKDLIRKYTRNSIDESGNELFRRLNAMLRGEIPEDEKLRSIADTISGAIRKTRLDYDVICYRSVDFPIYLDRHVGSIFKETQLISTSVREKGALNKPFKITIYAKKGTRAAYIEEISAYGPQRELLIDKDTVFRVISKSENDIELEVIR